MASHATARPGGWIGLGRVALVPAQPGLRLPGFGGYGPPGPARGPAVADIAGHAVKTEARGDLRGALAGRMTLGRVRYPGKPMPAQRGLDGVMGHAGLGGDGVDRAVLHYVPLVQVAGHVWEAKLAQRRQPPGVPAVWPPLTGRCRRCRVDVRQVARQPVLAEPGLAADRREASPLGELVQDERPDVGVAMASGDDRGDMGQVAAGALLVRLGDDLRWDDREHPHCL